VGGAVLCAALAFVHDMPRGPDSPMANTVIGAAVAGLGAAAMAAFVLARAVGVFKACMAATVAVAGAALVGVLTVPADVAAGRAGVVTLLGVSLAIIGLGFRVRRRALAAA
jgi:hypothetical protein